ncbi:transposase [Chryseobacterium sp. FH2]|uniref:hypothetical protein n=1 Tax=Chryseobacterium sp. FH2 TaxID=1674291 RepID=UPI00065AD211|nr:hypothetical protein [Chryseobacterium sp. FH2]KMQ68928.1 transposase [Chryseobacterium sp. FH2]
MNFKNIHIGSLIYQRVQDSGIESHEICNFFKCENEEIQKTYQCKSMESDILLKWSELLKYDFFRIYTQHMVLYSPKQNLKKEVKGKSLNLRKNFYPLEIISFMIELIETGEKTKKEVITDYRISKTTLYKWLVKYKK